MTTTTMIAPTSSDTTTDCGSGTILVAVNGRKSGWRALDWAVAESALHQRRLRILHVTNWPHVTLDPMDPMGFMPMDRCPSHTLDQAKLILDEAVQRARIPEPMIVVTAHLEIGSVRAEILHAGRDDALIVIGEGRRRWHGSPRLASRTARRARSPVVVVKLLDERVGEPSTGGARAQVCVSHGA